MGDSVPTLSAHDIDTPAFAQALAAAYETFGFAVVCDHGIDPRLSAACLADFRAFFALPEIAKRRYHRPGTGGARGFTPFGIETAKNATHHDLKEFWHVGRELPPGHRLARFMPPNFWPAEIPGMRERALALFDAFDALGRRLLGAIAVSLGQPRTFFEDKVELGNSVLRIIHYPATHEVASGVRAGAHEDINVITLLLGAEEPGLEIQTRQGRWLAIDAPPGSVVCNVGDMLQRLTHGRLRSTTHRVVNPPCESARNARYSLPYFLHFNPDFEIRTLGDCVPEGDTAGVAPPILADDYLQQRLREIRLL
jgi:isopenicillin N synthase-like dioxygenase